MSFLSLNSKTALLSANPSNEFTSCANPVSFADLNPKTASLSANPILYL